jgi:MFS family permease
MGSLCDAAAVDPAPFGSKLSENCRSKTSRRISSVIPLSIDESIRTLGKRGLPGYPLAALNRFAAYLKGLRPQLPRPVWLLETGGIANSLGNGIVIPFLIIYLHEVRHFGLGASGLVVATLLGIGLLGSPFAGRIVDRIGARTTLMASLALLALGYGGFPFVRHPWQAFGLAAIAGAGNAGFAPSHSSLLAALTSRDQRTVAYALTRVTDNLGFGIGGLIGGLIATTEVPESFNLLFAVDAGTFVAFMGLLLFVPAPPLSPAAARLRGGYAAVLADRTFLWLLGLTALLVAAAYAQISTTLPPYVKEHASVSEAGIGIIFFVNSAVLVLAQLPVARALRGRRRLRALALTGAIFSGTCLLVLFAGSQLSNTTAVVLLCGAIVVFSIGECLHGAVNNPLIADLAPGHLIGRYMALRTSAWQLGFLAGPAIGSLLLARSPTALWIGCAGACALAAMGFLLLERQVPAEAAITPGPERVGSKAFRVLWRTSTVILDDPHSPGAQPSPHQASETSRAGEGSNRTA